MHREDLKGCLKQYIYFTFFEKKSTKLKLDPQLRIDLEVKVTSKARLHICKGYLMMPSDVRMNIFNTFSIFICNMSFRQLLILPKFSLKIFISEILQTPPHPLDFELMPPYQYRLITRISINTVQHLYADRTIW